MKRYTFQLRPQMIGYDSSIRNKVDIIRYTISILRYLIVRGKHEQLPFERTNILGDGQILLVIYIDKMSRAFIAEENKIHSFQFSFLLQEDGESLLISFHGVRLDNTVCSILTRTFEKSEDDESIELLLERCWTAIEEVEESREYEICKEIVTYLLSFESGYIRFDHDEVRSALNHPINHLDVNYSSSATFKIGSSEMKIKDFVEVLDLNSKCKFIS